MDRTKILWLCEGRYETDSLGQKIPKRVDLQFTTRMVDLTGQNRRVFCSVSGVSSSEFYEAGKQGLKPEYRCTMFTPDYHGEQEAILDGKRYAIYRTYQGKYETIDLYLSRESGVS